MLKLVYEILKNNFSVTGNILYDTVITGVLFIVFNNIAYKAVGELYDADIIDGKFAGHCLNFIIKIILILIAMFFMWLIHCFIYFFKWIPHLLNTFKI